MAEPDQQHAAAPLAGVRVLESSLLEPAALGMTLADLGAEVIKVEPPGGDYVRTMAWPIIDGVSLLHWHVNRGKRSVQLDLRTDAGVDLYLDLAARSDVVIEAMRPGALARRGITVERLRERRPDLVICSVSGWGMTGPYSKLPAHGIGFDAWAGLAPPLPTTTASCTCPTTRPSACGSPRSGARWPSARRSCAPGPPAPGHTSTWPRAMSPQ